MIDADQPGPDVTEPDRDRRGARFTQGRRANGRLARSGGSGRSPDRGGRVARSRPARPDHRGRRGRARASARLHADVSQCGRLRPGDRPVQRDRHPERDPLARRDPGPDRGPQAVPRRERRAGGRGTRPSRSGRLRSGPGVVARSGPDRALSPECHRRREVHGRQRSGPAGPPRRGAPSPAGRRDGAVATRSEAGRTGAGGTAGGTPKTEQGNHGADGSAGDLRPRSRTRSTARKRSRSS